MPTPSIVVCLNIQQLEFHRITILTRSVLFFIKVFLDSGFRRTLCGGEWQSIVGANNAFNDLGSSTARVGCCPMGSFMSNPFVAFSVADSCSACPSNALTTTANDDITCTNNVCPAGQVYLNTFYGCYFCPAGKEFVSTTAECTVCNAGKYQNSTTVAHAVCVPCEAGRYIVDDGQNVAEHDSSDSCNFCPVGTEFVSTIETCRICGFSTFQNQTDVPGPVCQTCPANTFITDNRVETVAHDELADCNACADGTVSTPGDQSCAKCPAGKRVFTNNQGVATCDDCSAGKYQSVAGELECESCPTGWYQTKTRQPFCLPW